MQTIFRLVKTLLSVSTKTVIILLPSFLVYFVLTQPEIIMNRGIPLIQISNPDKIHEILPNTKWSHMKPCGQFFDEQKEFNRALQCVNTHVWHEKPLNKVAIPRCFIVSASSPDVLSTKDKLFNFIPLQTLFGLGAVVGVYEPETMTVFVVENVDAAQVYRHELQHFFLHLYDPKTGGGGHHQDIWKKCEEPYYPPSIKAKLIAAIEEANNE